MKTVEIKNAISPTAEARIATLQTAPLGEYLVSRSNYNSRGSADLTTACVTETAITVRRENITDKSEVWARVKQLMDVRLIAATA